MVNNEPQIFDPQEKYITEKLLRAMRQRAYGDRSKNAFDFLSKAIDTVLDELAHPELASQMYRKDIQESFHTNPWVVM